jgi:hypothetical protein
MYRIFICLLALTTMAFSAKGQISSGGVPFGNSFSMLKSVVALPQISLKKLDTGSLLAEDELHPVPSRYGIYVDTLIDVKTQGHKEVVSGKGSLWRIRISSQNAKSIQVIFDKFVVPSGATLFLYNDNMTRHAGAFTKSNMRADSSFVVANFKGNHAIIEYFEPENAEYSGKVIIGSIAQAYKDETLTSESSSYVNINCPIGKDVQTAKHAVCKMIFRSGTSEYTCSGALINNARQNGTPYFLTANHCISKSTEASSLVTYYNYEVVGCDGDTLAPLSLSGAKLLSTGQPSDYTLLLLDETPTSSYQPYYAGWDAHDSAVAMVTGIHFPAGNTKKLSIDYDKIKVNTEELGWDDNTVSPISTHWELGYDVGETYGGSSGSPLFNSNKQIIGQLHGGDDVTDYYGRFCYSYAYTPLSYKSLKYYLDPDTTNIKSLGGYSPAGNIPDAFYLPEAKLLCMNTPMKFTDYSAFGPYDRKWEITPSSYAFANGTTESSAIPEIEFFNNTTYTVSLNLYVSGILQDSSVSKVKAGNSIEVSTDSKSETEICDCDFTSLNITASGASEYSWSIPAEDEGKISLDTHTGNTVNASRLSGFEADSTYTLTFTVVGNIATCSDTTKATFNIIKPGNDNIAHAIQVGYGKTTTFSNVCATVEDGEPAPPCSACVSQMSWCDEYGTGQNIVEHSIWFKFVPTMTSKVAISSSGFDNEIALYKADSYSDLLNRNYTLLAANDDRSSSNSRPMISSLSVTEGQPYWLQVDGSGGGLQDNFTINIARISSTGIDEETSTGIVMYPQPAYDHLIIKGEELSHSSVELNVYNMSGMCVLREKVDTNDGEISLNIAKWKSGVYVVRMNTPEKNYVMRMVKN